MDERLAGIIGESLLSGVVTEADGDTDVKVAPTELGGPREEPRASSPAASTGTAPPASTGTASRASSPAASTGTAPRASSPAASTGTAPPASTGTAPRAPGPASPQHLLRSPPAAAVSSQMQSCRIRGTHLLFTHHIQTLLNSTWVWVWMCMGKGVWLVAGTCSLRG
ncbi:mucin-7-like [Pseudoliparis swirei]|uniref:mucin-7-like n=1 Tax=Pseudoliparis swirei TaxID=2059687 RepID=UPI0024BE1756|nr:mucin-7-like [Pseudoliparis swirei]